MDTVSSRDGTSIAFDRSGTGPPVVLVGGALSDRSAGAALAAELAAALTAVAYDRRGRGDSGDTTPYTVEREVEDIEALIAHAGGSAFLFGHSSGAALAIEAVRAGAAIPKLALYEPPFIVDDSRPPLPEDYVERLRELAASDDPGETVDYFMLSGPGVPQEMLDELHGAPSWPAMVALAHTLAYDGTIMNGKMSGRPLPTEWATSVTVPTLVMDGGMSPPWQRNAVKALAELLPNAEHRTLEGQTHGADPAVLARLLIEFFAD